MEGRKDIPAPQAAEDQKLWVAGAAEVAVV